MAADDKQLLFWNERLFGLPASDVAEAVRFVRDLKIRNLTEELVAPTTVDAAVGCYFLHHAFEVLERYVPTNKLLKKLRDDREVWSAWCELRTAALMVEFAPEGTAVEMDPGRSSGAQPDLRVVVPDRPGARSIEIKSIGLSDEELAFCARMAPALSRFAPTEGFVTVGALLGDNEPRLSREQRRSAHRGGGKRIRSVIRSWPRGVSGASVVLHGAQDDYMRRVALRIRDAVRQLPHDDECIVAFYWTNGAPIRRLASFIRWDEIPRMSQRSCSPERWRFSRTADSTSTSSYWVAERTRTPRKQSRAATTWL